MRIESPDRERLALLVRAGEIFYESLDIAATLHNVAHLAIGWFTDICLIDLLDERSGRLVVTASASRDPERERELASAASLFYVHEFRIHPVLRVVETGEPFFLAHIEDATLGLYSASRQHEQLMKRLGYRSKIVVPILTRDHIFGALTFVRTRTNDEFGREDLELAIELGRRAGQAVANAKQFHREQHIAETLQRAFLPHSFHSERGVKVSTYYQPGSTESEIGGDWYDAFEDERGDLVIAIGDVGGKGVEAAHIMVLLRQTARIAALHARGPRYIVATCNRVLLSERKDWFATMFIGVLNRETRTLTYCSAGHAPPYLRLSNGAVRELAEPSPPLGVFRDVRFRTHRVRLPDSSVLVLYTDGIIEASKDIIAGQNALRDAIRDEELLSVANPASFIGGSLATEPSHDDVAIMVLDCREARGA